jgi:CRP-like cAMP-binding protein
MSQTPAGIAVLTRLELYFSARHTLRTMRQFAEVFDHDYDLVIIFLTVAEVALQAIFHLAAVNPHDGDIAESFKDLSAVGLSVLSIGESTGIPRETVRRKVRRLIDMGFLAMKDRDKSIYIPIATMTSPKMLDILANHVSEIGSLVRTVRFYSKEPVDP